MNDFPVNDKVQALAEHNYGEDCNILTAIAWDAYPDKSFGILCESFKALSPEVAAELNADGISFTVLGKGQSFSESGFINMDEIAVDLENWYGDLSESAFTRSVFLDKASEDEELGDKVYEILQDFARNLIAEIQAVLKEKQLTPDQLNQYILGDDVIASPVVIEDVDEYRFITTNLGLLEWRSNDESFWEFVDRKRGQLIGKSQIINPELLPDFLSDETIFAIN